MICAGFCAIAVVSAKANTIVVNISFFIFSLQFKALIRAKVRLLYYICIVLRSFFSNFNILKSVKISQIRPICDSELIGKAQRAILLELEIAHIIVAGVRVVEARIEEDVGRDILRHLQLELILPLHQRTVVRRVGIEA